MQIKCFSIVVCVAAALALAACGGKDEAPKAETPTPKAGAAAETAPEENALDGVGDGAMMMMEAQPVEVADGAEEEPNDLAGTTWQLAEFELTFRDNTTVHVKGGQIADLSPDGVEGFYHLEKNGAIEVTVMGQSHTGTWDGKNLVISSMIGKKVE